MATTNVSPRERQLVDIARRANRYLAHESHGQHEDLLIGRELVRILALYDDVAPTADADRVPSLVRQPRPRSESAQESCS